MKSIFCIRNIHASIVCEEEMETNIAIIIVLIIVIVFLAWYGGIIKMPVKEGIDVRAMAHPLTGQYSTSSRVLSRTYS